MLKSKGEEVPLASTYFHSVSVFGSVDFLKYNLGLSPLAVSIPLALSVISTLLNGREVFT